MAVTASAASERPLFSRRTVTLLVVVGLAAFAAFALLSAFGEDFRSGRDGRGHALSVSAIGFQGIVRLVRLTGGDTRLLRGEDQLDTEDLLVVAVEPQTPASMLDALIARRGARATLLILPKWATRPDPRHQGWVQALATLPPALAGSALPRIQVGSGKAPGEGNVATGSGLLEGISVTVPPSPQTVTGPELEPLLTAPNRGILLARMGEGPLYLLADPDLMNNQGLRNAATAQAALAILRRLNATDARSVAFDLSVNGFGGKPSILKLPFEPPFLALTVALVAAALLAGLHGAVRFGQPRPEARAIAFGKRALVENSAGLIQLARREHRTGGAYAELIRDLTGRAAGAPATLHGEALDAYLDRLSPAGGPAFTTLADQARRAANAGELLAAAQALSQWKKDVIQ